MAATKYRRFGRDITDAKDDLTIRVKPCDIAGAVCRDHEKCVLANAIKRITRAKWCDVGPSTVFVGSDNRGRRYRLNGLGREVVRFFDEHKGKAAPSEIVLVAPKPKESLGARRGEKGGKRKTKYVANRRKPTR